MSRPVILAGDFSCIIDADGRSSVGIAGGCSKLDVTSRFLIDTVKDAKLLDVFSTPADGAQRRCTWSRPHGSIHSRIDFLFMSRAFSVRSTGVEPVFFSDHCL
eukprot:g11335.t1